MYLLASRLSPLPVISLQTGLTVAMSYQPIVDPGALELIGLIAKTVKHHDHRMIMTRDVREFAIDCLIIDNEEELTDPHVIVRLEGLWERPYHLIGKPVVSDMGRSLGRVDDYTINSDSYLVQKLYVRQSLLRSLLGTSLIIDRTQIIDVTAQRVIVRDATARESQTSSRSVGTGIE